MGDIADDHRAEIIWSGQARGAMWMLSQNAMDRADKLAANQARRRTSCKFCGQAPVAWFKEDGRWQLLEPSGEVHRCGQSGSGGE